MYCVLESFCGEQDIVLGADDSRSLASFGYPGNNIYQGQFSCKWIVTAPEGLLVRVEVLDVQVNPPFDVLTLNKRVIASIPEEDYISEENVLEIVYSTYPTDPVSLSQGFNVVLSTYQPPGKEFVSFLPFCLNLRFGFG